MSHPVKIGTVWPISGPPGVRVIYPRLHAGTCAGLAQINQHGGFRGREVELVVEDSHYDVETTRRAVRRLVEEENVLALLNANGTPQLTAVLPFLAGNDVPLLLPFAGDEDWYRPPRPGVLGLNSPFNDIGVLLGRWAAADGYRRILIIHPDYPSISPVMGTQVARSFERAAAGNTSHTVCVPLGSRDGEHMADEVDRADPEAVVILTNLPELEALTTEWQRRGRATPLYSWNANVSQDAADRLGERIEGMKGFSDLTKSPHSTEKPVAQYRSAMAEISAEERPDLLSLQAFAHTSLFGEALNRVVGDLNSHTLLQAFYTFERYETNLLAPVTFNSRRHVGIEGVQPMELRSGQWIPCGPLRSLPSHIDS